MLEWNIEFVRRMNALVDELPILTQDDVRTFWEEFKPIVIQAFSDASDWRTFKELVLTVVDEVS